MGNLKVFWQCQAYSPNTLHWILIQFTLTLVSTGASFKVHYSQAEAAYFIDKDLPEKAAKHWGVFSPLDCRLSCLRAGFKYWTLLSADGKFSALKSDTSLFLWLVLTLTPASTVLCSVAVCWKLNFQPCFLLKCAPPLVRTDVFAATLVQVNNHNSKVQAGFRVYPLELS